MEQPLKYRLNIMEVKMDTLENQTICEVKTDLKLIKADLKTLQLHMDERFITVHQEMAAQTRWFMAALLATGMMVSVVAPIMMKWLG